MTIARAHLVDPAVTRWYLYTWVSHPQRMNRRHSSSTCRGREWPGTSDVCPLGEFDLLRPEQPSISQRGMSSSSLDLERAEHPGRR